MDLQQLFYFMQLLLGLGPGRVIVHQRRKDHDRRAQAVYSRLYHDVGNREHSALHARRQPDLQNFIQAASVYAQLAPFQAYGLVRAAQAYKQQDRAYRL